MKFNEYVALSQHLEKRGSNINEFVKTTTGKPLNEATDPDPDQIKTSSGGGAIRSPRFAFVRGKLNRLAKAAVELGKKEVITKYTSKILNSMKTVTNKIVALSAEGKTPEEIKQLLGKHVSEIQKTQEQAMSMLNKVLEQLLGNFKSRADKLIQKNEKLSDNSKSKLDLYWILLETQVQQIFFKKMVGAREDFINGAVKGNEDLAKVINELTGGTNWNVELEKLKKKAKDEIDEYKKANEPKGNTPESTDETPKSFDEFKVAIEKAAKNDDKDKRKEILTKLVTALKASEVGGGEQTELGKLFLKAGLSEKEIKNA